MRIYRSLDELSADFGPSAVTIGNFDGVHVGHRRILRRLRKLADANGWKARCFRSIRTQRRSWRRSARRS